MRLPDKGSGLVSCLGLRRRRPVMGEVVLAGLLERDLDLTGDKPRMTSCLSVEKKLCFLSMVVCLFVLCEVN